MACLAALLSSVSTTVATAPSAKPNIVFIIADDLGWADVAFHGGNAPTPNLDRLRSEGVELAQHYVAPVCSPTRTGHVTDLIAAEAVKWIEARGEAPFFLYAPFTAIHLPLKEPEEWVAAMRARMDELAGRDRDALPKD